MPETDLQHAATRAVNDIFNKYTIHSDPNYLRSLLEIAFMQGALWYNQSVIDKTSSRLIELQEEAANARS